MRKAFTMAAVAVTMSMLLCGVATAGYVYEAETTMNADQGGRNEKTKVKVWVEDQSARIEFEEGGDSGFMKEGAYLITRDAGETLLFVDPKEKTYSEFNLGQTMQAAGAVMQQMGGMFKIEYKDISVEKVSEDAGPEILGYGTVHSVVNSSYTQSMSVMGRTMNQKNVMKQELWTTPKIDASAFSVWMRPDKRFKGMVEGLDEYMEQTFSQISGTPLRVIINTTTTDDNGRSSKSSMITEVTHLSEEDVDDERFAIPEDYEKTDLVASGDGEEGGFDMSKMKDIFKRNKGN